MTPRAFGKALLAAVLLAAPSLNAASDPDEARRRMVEEQIRERGVTNAVVLAALARVPRHQYVSEGWQNQAYTDQPLPIGHGQTISQPYIVGLMTETLDPKPGQRILEVGTGSGYQAAVLAQITTNTYTIEIVKPLYDIARPRLIAAGLPDGQIRQGDGYFGWKEAAPFDGIIVTAAADHIPPPLLQQLKPGGRMVIPIGSVQATQRLVLVEKDAQGKVRTRSILAVRFVPLTGGPREGAPRP